MISLRQASFPRDVETVRLLFRDYAAHLATANISIEHFEQELAELPSPYRMVLLAEVNLKPAGCVALKALTVPNENAVEMKRLWIRPEHRGLKLGKKLALSAALHAQNARFDAMYLDTVPSVMPEANRMYESLGFQQIERYNQNKTEDLVFFRLDLKPSAQSGSVSHS